MMECFVCRHRALKMMKTHQRVLNTRLIGLHFRKIYPGILLEGILKGNDLEITEATWGIAVVVQVQDDL